MHRSSLQDESLKAAESLISEARACEALEMEKVKKGGMPWKKEVLYASRPVTLTSKSVVCFLGDYFQQMYDFAIDLIKWLDRPMGLTAWPRHGKAYVDSQTAEEVQKNRGGGPKNLPGAARNAVQVAIGFISKCSQVHI